LIADICGEFFREHLRFRVFVAGLKHPSLSFAKASESTPLKGRHCAGCVKVFLLVLKNSTDEPLSWDSSVEGITDSNLSADSVSIKLTGIEGCGCIDL